MDPVMITLILFVLMVVLFVTEIIPLSVTSMVVCIALVLTDVLTIPEAFEGFINTNVILYVAMFIVGGALFETGMANRIGGVVTKFAKTERQLIVAVMLVVGIMSAFLSNTGTAAVLIPVIIGAASKSGYARSKLLIPLVFAAAIGGEITLIGAPPNLMAKTTLEEVGSTVGFFEFGLVGIPLLIAAIIYMATIGYKLLPDREITDTDGTYNSNQDFSHVPAWKQWLSFIILAAAILGMIFDDVIGIKLCITGCIAALALILTGVISEKDALKSIDLKVVFLFGGTMALAAALVKTGAGEVVARAIINLLGENASPYLLTFAVFLICAILTNFMSNTAATALMLPICISMSQQLGIDPRAIVMTCVIGCSCAYITPIGMPANTMVFSIGGYKVLDYTKVGLPLMVIAGIISMVLLPIFFPFY